MKKGLVFSIFFILSILSAGFRSYAADAKVNISTETVEKDGTIKVKVEVTSEESIGGYLMYVNYDEKILEFQPGSDNSSAGKGKIALMYVLTSDDVKTVTKELTFIAKEAGTSNITISADSEIYNVSYDVLNITSTEGKVTVTAPVATSSNNFLKGLTVYGLDAFGESTKLSINPAFNRDKTEYKIKVTSNIEKLSIKATAEDSKSKISVSGIKLATGDNITTIVVTAENGNTKTYYIYTEKAKPKETTTEEITTNKEDEYVLLNIGGVDYYVPQSLENVAIPEGFEEDTYTYKETKITVAKGVSKNLIIVYVLDANKENGKFLIYDESRDIFYDMVNIQSGGKLYTIVNKPDSVTIPENYVATTIVINKVNVDVWMTSELSDFAYVYAMNYAGETALYCYDKTEKTMQRVTNFADVTDKDIEYESAFRELEQLRKENKELARENVKLNRNIRKIFITMGIVLSTIIVVSLIICLVKSKKKDDDYIDPQVNDKNNVLSEDEYDKALDRLFEEQPKVEKVEPDKKIQEITEIPKIPETPKVQEKPEGPNILEYNEDFGKNSPDDIYVGEKMDNDIISEEFLDRLLGFDESEKI